MEIKHFFDKRTWTLTYLVYDPDQCIGVVIDTVTDYDPKSGRTWNESNEAVAKVIDELGLDIPYVLDTHAHADHLTGMPFFKKRTRSKTVIGTHIKKVQKIFRDVFNIGDDFPIDGSQFDVLLKDSDVLDVGPFQIKVMHTPGHTPACNTYQIEDALFVGDTLFMPDYGAARCDFPGGSAETLYDSIQRIYALPPQTRIFVCHDYQPGGRELQYETTVGAEKAENIQVNAKISRQEFVDFRTKRDEGLSMPTLLLPSIQVNIRAGEPPTPESNGTSYIKIPLNVL